MAAASLLAAAQAQLRALLSADVPSLLRAEAAKAAASPMATLMLANLLLSVPLLLLAMRLVAQLVRMLRARAASAGGGASWLSLNAKHGADVDVGAVTDFYSGIHAATGSGTEEERLSKYDKMVDAYYTLATDFYENGWGESFHFGTRFARESLAESLLRHEYALAARLGLRSGQTVLDVGCGVGGPARNIARFTGARIVGVSLNQYQVDKAARAAAAEGLRPLLRFLKADFMRLGEAIPAGAMDAAYAIEATCHAPDRAACFANVYAALKPGALFGGYEWVSTAAYDAADPAHAEIMRNIEVGNGLPTIVPARHIADALAAAGFVVEEIRDLAPESTLPWFQPFLEPLSLKGFGASRIGIPIIHAFVAAGEALGWFPRGSAQMHHNLTLGARGLIEGGKRGIFTVMLRFVARKPLKEGARPAVVAAPAASPAAAGAGARKATSPSPAKAAAAATASAGRGRKASKSPAPTAAAKSGRGRKGSASPAAAAAAARKSK